MSTPYSSSPRTKARNSTVSAWPLAEAVEAWRAWAGWDMARSFEKSVTGGSGKASGSGRERHSLGEAAGVDDQRDAAIAEDGGAGHAGDALVVGLEVLDHDLLLAEQFVDLQRKPSAIGLDHHGDARWRVLALAAHRRRQAVLAGKVDQRQVVVAHAQHARLAGDGAHVGGRGQQRLDHHAQR